jgi:hypothetical protein
VNIVSRLKEGKRGEKLTEEYGVGPATLWDSKISAEWHLKFVSTPASKDGSSTEQIGRRVENVKVQDFVGKRLLQKLSQDRTLSEPVFVKGR